MAVNTKLDVKPVDNVVATVYGQKDSGLFLTCPLTTLLHWRNSPHVCHGWTERCTVMYNCSRQVLHALHRLLNVNLSVVDALLSIWTQQC